MGDYCDICGEKDNTSRIEIRIMSDAFRNSNYIIHKWDLCNECYLSIFKKISLILEEERFGVDDR